MNRLAVVAGIAAGALACAACATVPPYVAPAAGEPTAQITYVRIANAMPGYFNEDLQISHGGCQAFSQLSAFPKGDKDPAHNEPRTVAVRAEAPTCFRLYVEEMYSFHGLAACPSVFELNLAPGDRYTIRHIFEAKSENGSILYRCRPEVTNSVTGQPAAVRIIEDR